MNESWITIKEFPSYSISNKGRIKRIINSITSKKGKFLIPNKLKSGHLWITLRKNNTSFRRLVHRLVLSNFISPCPQEMETRHLDGNPSNNKIENLVWGTRKENCRDKVNSINNQKGSKHGMSKLNETMVIEIRKLNINGVRPRDLGPKYHVSPQLISKIIHKRIWNHI